jgi:hypothetical protein
MAIVHSDGAFIWTSVDETGLFVWNWGPGLDFIEIGFKSSLISYILEINSLIMPPLKLFLEKCFSPVWNKWVDPPLYSKSVVMYETKDFYSVFLFFHFSIWMRQQAMMQMVGVLLPWHPIAALVWVWQSSSGGRMRVAVLVEARYTLTTDVLIQNTDWFINNCNE